MQAFLWFLPSSAENFYRVWRKYLPRTSTDVHGNTVYNSKYVNTSKNMFCSANPNVVCRSATLICCLHLMCVVLSYHGSERSDEAPSL